MRERLEAMGRYLFGAAAVAIGAASIVLRQQLVSGWAWPGAGVFLWITSVLQIVAGVALPAPKWSRYGALTIAVIYAIFALTFVPAIVAAPAVYYTWGNVFYPLGVVTGALVAAQRFQRVALIAFGLCNISYAIEQVEFFARTNTLVPAWIPFGASFWNVVTTVGFAAAGIAFIANYRALLAARLLATMFLIFVVAVWLPALVAAPSSVGNWSEGLETLLLAGSAWVMADDLRGNAAP